MFVISIPNTQCTVFTNIWLIFMEHVGKYTIHWVIYPGMLPVPVLVTMKFKKVNWDPHQKIWHLLGKGGSATCIYIQKYCWWKKSGQHQLRLVVYRIIYRVSKTSQVVVWDFWTINLIMHDNSLIHIYDKNDDLIQCFPHVSLTVSCASSSGWRTSQASQTSERMPTLVVGIYDGETIAAFFDGKGVHVDKYVFTHILENLGINLPCYISEKFKT